jgi:hypothetical protein
MTGRKPGLLFEPSFKVFCLWKSELDRKPRPAYSRRGILFGLINVY